MTGSVHLVSFTLLSYYQMYVPNMMPWPHGAVYEAPAIQPFANGGFPNHGPPSGGFPSSPTNLPPRFNHIPGGMSRRPPFDGGPGHHHTPHQSGAPRARHRMYSGRDDSYGPHSRNRRRDEDHRPQVSGRIQPAVKRRWAGGG